MRGEAGEVLYEGSFKAKPREMWRGIRDLSLGGIAQVMMIGDIGTRNPLERGCGVALVLDPSDLARSHAYKHLFGRVQPPDLFLLHLDHLYPFPSVDPHTFE